MFKVRRIVATLTTLPDRYHLLLPCLQSLRSQSIQFDAIYLAVPKTAKRLNKEYPPLPSEITDICTVIQIDQDYGPITKLYGALISESDPDTIILCSDDDVIHDSNLLQILINHEKDYPGSAICGTGALISRGLFFISIHSSLQEFKSWNGLIGFNMDKEGRNVDLVFGVAGVLYQRGFFPATLEDIHKELLSHGSNDDYIFLNDDVLISGYLSKKRIKRRVFTDIPVVVIPEDHRDDALSFDVFKMISRLDTAIANVKQLGYYDEMEELPLDETVAWKVIVAIIFSIIIIIMIWMYFLI